MLTAVAVALLGAGAGFAEEAPRERLLSTSAAVRTGMLSSSYSYFGGSYSSFYAVRTIEGRYVWNGLVAEGSLFSPSRRVFGASEGATIGLRFGYTGERFAVLAGPVMQLSPSAKPALQLLPSVKAHLSFGAWGLRAGLFDLDGLVPAHLGVDVGGFGLSYVAPLGGLASARVRIAGRGHLLAQAMVFSLFNTTQAYFTLGGEVDFGDQRAGAYRPPVAAASKESSR